MSHYPSTAELAAFRRSIHNANPDVDWRIGPDAPCFVNDPPAAAWPDERRDGIGYLETAPDAMCIVIPDGAVHTGAIARRRAGVLRSRAYRAMDPGNHWLPRAERPTAAHDELTYGIPTLYRDCECCGNPAGSCDCYGA